MLDGVRNSAGIEENTGTRFGGLGDLIAAANTSRTVSSDGWMPSCCGHALSLVSLHWLDYGHTCGAIAAVVQKKCSEDLANVQ
jgi:hypothetical protein